MKQKHSIPYHMVDVPLQKMQFETFSYGRRFSGTQHFGDVMCEYNFDRSVAEQHVWCVVEHCYS